MDFPLFYRSLRLLFSLFTIGSSLKFSPYFICIEWSPERSKFIFLILFRVNLVVQWTFGRWVSPRKYTIQGFYYELLTVIICAGCKAARFRRVTGLGVLVQIQEGNLLHVCFRSGKYGKRTLGRR